MRIVWGLVGIAVGVLIVWKTYWLETVFGKMDWAERHLGGGLGGTYLLYKIFGIAAIVLSAMYMFGVLGNVLTPFGSIFGGLAPR